MRQENTPRFTLQALMLCILFNGAMLAAFFFMARELFQGLHTHIAALSAAPQLPEAVRASLNGLADFIRNQERFMPFYLFGIGGLITLLLWLALQVMTRSLTRTVLALAGDQTRAEGDAGARKTGSAGREVRGPSKLEPVYSPEAAIQILALLQRQGRLIDFLQEDLGSYEDAQIGAAVRSVHEGCREALREHLELKPVYEQEEEGAVVSVKAGFDPKSIRLTGNVVGNPPFRGVLRHRGWKVSRVELPQPVSDQGKPGWVLAPAEVELEA